MTDPNVSRANKYLNKLKGWAKREGLVQVEIPEAMGEFMPNAHTIPDEVRESVGKLFEDWFMWERPLIRSNMTPFQLFLRSHEHKLKPKDIEIYRRFSAERAFGLFNVESVDSGRGMELRRISDKRIFHVVEVAASEEVEGGEYLIARLIPFEDHWVIASLVGAYPSEASYAFERSLSTLDGKAKDIQFKPRDFLRLLLPKVDWYEQGLPRVKARLAMILQRWKSEITVSQIERDIEEAHAQRADNRALFNSLIARAPSADDAQEALEVLAAFWNLNLPTKDVRGPKEQMLFRDLSHFVMSRLTKEELGNQPIAIEKSKKLLHEWLDQPQKELEGRTPMEVVLEERRAMGNPREDFDVSLVATPVALGGEEAQGEDFVNQGIRLLVEKKPAEALKCLQEAYPLMKKHPENFRALGNMATAYVMLGRREEAMEMLRAALRANPDYSVARNNLHLLENLTPAEFKRRHESGLFEKMNVIQER